MLSKKERVSRDDFGRQAMRVTRFLYGSIKEFSGKPSGAVVVSKKITPTAVARNKIRRRIYGIIRALIRKGALEKSVVVYPNKEALKAPFKDLKEALEKALRI